MPIPNIFGSQPIPAPAAVAPLSTNIPAPAPVVDLSAPVVDPAAPIEPAKPDEPVSPLDVYKDLWETAPVDKDNPAPEVLPLVAALDPKAVQEKLATVDFATAVTPETMAAIEAGGEGANAAFLTAMNEIGRNVMTQAMLVNNKLMETAVERTKEQTLAGIPELIRTQTLANKLTTDNPLFSDPAIKPLLDMVQAQFAVKNPAATPDQLTTMAQDYIAATVKSLTPEVAVVVNPLAPAPETDFSDFLGKTQLPAGS